MRNASGFDFFRPPSAMHVRDTEALGANRRFLQYFTVLFSMILLLHEIQSHMDDKTGIMLSS